MCLIPWRDGDDKMRHQARPSCRHHQGVNAGPAILLTLGTDVSYALRLSKETVTLAWATNDGTFRAVNVTAPDINKRK